jgi:hypothetical protein
VTHIVIDERVLVVPTRKAKAPDCVEVILKKGTVKGLISYPIVSGEIPSSLDCEEFT